MLVLMLHQEHTNLCGKLHNELFFINTYILKYVKISVFPVGLEAVSYQ